MSGMETMSPALAGELSTTEPPGKPHFSSVFQYSFTYGTTKKKSLAFTVTSFVENKLICMHHFCMGGGMLKVKTLE